MLLLLFFKASYSNSKALFLLNHCHSRILFIFSVFWAVSFLSPHLSCAIHWKHFSDTYSTYDQHFVRHF